MAKRTKQHHITIKQIERWRSDYGLTQRDFWQKVCVGQSAGSRYENARDIPEPICALLRLIYSPAKDSANLLRDMRE